MCVICHKAAGEKLPSKETIEKMWNKNPDGAGIMWRVGKKVAWSKGFMKLEHFLAYIEDHRKMLEETEVGMHFRITTHGGTNPQNTHPFTMDKGTDVHALAGKCKCVMMHNGILPVKPRDKKYSDTAELAMRARESGDPMKFLWAAREFIGEGNRVLAFGPKHTYFIGTWHDGKDGDKCKYSNMNWDVQPMGFYSMSGYNYPAWWDEDDYYDNGKSGVVSDYFWSHVDRCWKNKYLKEVPFEDVDPQCLTPADENRYWDEYAVREDALFDGDEEAQREYDEWMAEQYGMYCEDRKQKEVAS